MKQITTDKNDIRLGKIPHETLTLNVVVVHLFLSVAILKFGDIKLALNVPIAISLIIITWTYFKNKQIRKSGNCFLKINWQLTINRYKYLIISYIVYAIILSIGALVSSNAPISMDGTNIIYTVFNRISVIPLFITILVLVISGSGSMFNVSRGEVPTKMIDKYC